MTTNRNIWAGGGLLSARRYAAVGALIIAIVGVLVFVPEWQGTLVSDKVAPAETLRLVNEYRRTLAQIIGGLVLLFGLYLTWRRIAATEAGVEIANESQVTDRFTRAIEQLGSEQVAVRLGGIYALERIARDSQKDHWTVMEVLTGLVRDRAVSLRDAEEQETMASGDWSTPTDVQAILTVLGRRKWIETEGARYLDLSRSFLRGASLRGNFSKADLTLADLSDANLWTANLSEATLDGANLSNSSLLKADLRNAHFLGADLSGARGVRLTPKQGREVTIGPDPEGIVTR